jgi:hypothetical protein
MSEDKASNKKAYRFLTGPDDAAFCQRVSDALRDGWVLYGAPLMQVDAQGNRHCGQAVVLPEFFSTYSEN